jgi:hypothetical protein
MHGQSDALFAELSLLSVTLGKAFAECFQGFAECFRHSAKRLIPVVMTCMCLGGHFYAIAFFSVFSCVYCEHVNDDRPTMLRRSKVFFS